MEKRYADGIIENTLEMGPYYVIAKDLAFIHGRSDQGVITKQLAVTVSRNPIIFSDTKKARLLIVLAAEDGESHMQTLSCLAQIFMDEKKIASICDFTDVNDIYEAFMKEDK